MGMQAAPVTPSEALSRVQASGPRKVASGMSVTNDLAYTYKNAKGTNMAYLFNNSRGGYLILPADDLGYPVLGYSDTGKVDPSDINPEMRWWLEQYSRQIEWAAEKKLNPSKVLKASTESWAAIAPMCKTNWNQDAPYNDLCPGRTNADPGPDAQHAYTGCVATSMAQLMKYHNYPEKGTGGVVYTPSKLGYKLMIRFSDRSFDWGNMLDNYEKGHYNDAEAQAVAYLMKACGYAVQMNYGFDASGTQGNKIANALRTYFKYDSKTLDRSRDVYTTSQWAQMIYDNLKNVGPVVLNGQSPLEGGHSFIVDGYDGNGYFHLNWGWGGTANGYYSLEALNPDAQGIGGAVGGFNFMQNAILGAQPPKGEQVAPVAEMIQYGSLVGELSGKKLKLSTAGYKSIYFHGGVVYGWYNFCDRPVSVTMGIGITGENGTTFEPRYEDVKFRNTSDFNLDSGYGINASSGEVELPDLPDGKYKVTMCSFDRNLTSSGWTPVLTPVGDYNYIELTVASGKYSVKNFTTSTIDVTSAKIDSELYYGSRFRISADMKNDSDMELRIGICPRLYQGSTLCFEGESMLVSLDGGESKEVEWISSFTKVNGDAVTEPTDFTLVLYSPESGEEIGRYGTVTMNPSLGRLLVNLNNFTIADSERMRDVEVDGRTYMTLYKVKDPSNVDITVSVVVKSGYFDSMVRMSVDKMVAGRQVPFMDEVYAEWQMAPASDTPIDYNIKLDMSNDEKDTIYCLVTKYTSGYSQLSWGTFYFTLGDPKDSGISEIESGFAGETEYYTLQGVRVLNPEKGSVVIERRGDKSRKVKI